MKALNFLEWHLEIKSYFIYFVNEVADFYNQPFTIDMLVNPHQINAVECVSQDDPCIMEWVKSESLRLFEGWEIDNEVRCYRYYDGEQYSKYPIVHFNGYDGLTLNDFITIFTKYNKGKLNFNESNETIEKLFGEDKK